MNRRTAAAIALIAAAAALAPGCRGCRRKGPPRQSAEEAVAERRKAGLESLIKRAEKGPLIPFGHVLAVVDQSLVQQLLTSALPIEHLVKERYRVAIDTAAVLFDDNFALVKLAGRVSLADQQDSTFADVAVYGALDVVELDPLSGVLRGRVKVIGFDASKVTVMGLKTKTAEDLLEDFAGERVDTFSSLFSDIQIPVKLQREIVIPALGPQGPVRIAEARIPISGSVTDLTAYKGRLYVSIAAAVHPGGEGEQGAGS